MQQTLITILIFLTFIACQEAPSNNEKEMVNEPETESSRVVSNAEQWVREMVKVCGGKENLKALKDVEYQYTYRGPEGKEDVSLERYLFDGELSWGKYEKHNKSVLPDQEGTVIQAFNGDTTVVLLDGKRLTDPDIIRRADFTRKTNYYWFVMMFKLLDEGINYKLLPDQLVDSVSYKRIEITFDQGIGDVQDKYVLYINPDTKLVDQFLFTVMDFGRAEPLLMKVNYDTVEELKLPLYRKYAPANWDGQVRNNAWTEEICKEVTFDNGFNRNLFTLSRKR